MGEKEHLEILKQGVEAWNKWREENPNVKPDLSMMDLSKVNLHKTVFDNKKYWPTVTKPSSERANLSMINFSKVNLTNTNLNYADLSWADLTEANLTNAKLVQSYLRGTNFSKAKVMRAHLTYAFLHSANFTGAVLNEAFLYIANLKYATFKDASLKETEFKEDEKVHTVAYNLKAEQLGGADISGAKLPAHVISTDIIDRVNDASKVARNLFMILLAECLYSIITIGTTTDVSLLTNSASSKLPVLNAEVPIVYFYTTAPIILTGTYFYFNLYLLRLFENLSSLPAIFEDGRRIDQRVFPWLITGLLHSNFKRLQDRRPPMTEPQGWLSILLVWFSVPITLFLFWVRYLTSHDTWGVMLHLLLILVTGVTGAIFFRLIIKTLKGIHIAREYRFFPFYKMQREGVAWLALFTIIPLVISLVVIVSPFRLELPLYNPYVNFYETDVSTKPDNWDELRLTVINGANLKGSDLRHSDLVRAFMVKADLRKADILSAYLWRADLREALLKLADLKGADLRETDLRGADLRGAKNLTAVQIKSAIIDMNTKLPEGMEFNDAFYEEMEKRGEKRDEEYKKKEEEKNK